MTKIIGSSDLCKSITFGKYRGYTWKYVMENDPDYIQWAEDNVEFIEFSDAAWEKIEEALERYHGGES